MIILPTPDPKAVATLVSNVTQTMLGLSFAARDLGAICESTIAPGWCTAMLPIPGVRPVTIALSSDETSCAALGAAMFACSVAEVDASMMSDSLRELVNMTAGQIKSALGLDQALGLPKIMGDPERQRIGSHAHWKSVPLRAGSVELVVWLAETVF